MGAQYTPAVTVRTRHFLRELSYPELIFPIFHITPFSVVGLLDSQTVHRAIIDA